MSSILSVEQIERVRRKQWQSASELAEELYAMFMSPDPYRGPPLNLEQPGGGPIINIINNNTGPPITTGPPVLPGDPVDPVTNPPATGGGGFPPAAEVEVDETPSTFPVAIPLAGWGIVQSKVGDNVYLVDVYIGNPATSAKLATMNITQRQIDIDDTIPAGTETPVTLFTVLTGGGTGLKVVSGCMQVPVFLERP
jgi:hypothetical protein